MNPNSNIILIGFMGTGKTTIGKLIADKLNMQFLDMDDIIVQEQNKPIPAIFSDDGEPHFRALERELVKKLSAQSGNIIGAGGGIVINPDNISDFSRTGLVICLSAKPDTIMKRIQSDTNRPLLEGGDKMNKILSLLESRRDLYDAVENQIDTTDLSTEQVSDQVVSLYKQSLDQG